MNDIPSQAADLALTAETWLDDHVDEFDPLSWSDNEKRRIRRKAFGEAGLYLLVVDAADAPDVTPAIRDLLSDHVNDRRYFELIKRNPQRLLKYGYPLLYERDYGSLRQEASDAIDYAFESPTAWAFERPPHRLLDLWYFCHLYGERQDEIDHEAVLELSNVHYPPDIVDASLRDVYSLTHNIFYYTHFGLPHPTIQYDAVPYDLGTELTGFILRFMADDDCDIVLELLLCALVQRQISTEFMQFAVSWVATQAEPYDFVPGPDMEGDVPARAQINDAEIDVSEMGEWDDRSKEWLRHYHTNLIASMFGHVLQQRWPAFLDDAPESDLDHQAHEADLLALGDALSTLADYDLEHAAPKLAALADSPVVEEYSGVYDAAIDYLDRQRTHDDVFGFWTDEYSLYVGANLGDEESFNSDLVEPSSAECRRALDAARARSRGEDGG